MNERRRNDDWLVMAFEGRVAQYTDGMDATESEDEPQIGESDEDDT